MSDYRPIPIPWRTRWRQIRIHLLPVLVFLAALAVVAYLWDQELTPATMSGEVYAASSDISAPRPGTIESLLVEPFDYVEAGQIIAYIRPLPPEQVAASLGVLSAEVELARLGSAGPLPDLHRNLHNRRSTYQDWLEARARLASLRVRMNQAEREFRRLDNLRSKQFISESAYDEARSGYEALRAEVAEVEELVSTLEVFIQDAGAHDGIGDAAFEATLRWQEARLRELEAELEPWPVYAPISGVVTGVAPESGSTILREGVFVREGDAIMKIRSHQPEYIIGYARLPVVRPPEEGAGIEVIRRGGRRQSATATVVKVGSHFEPLGPAFRRPFGDLEERAMPILISLPADLDLRPGEIVDLYIR